MSFFEPFMAPKEQLAGAVGVATTGTVILPSGGGGHGYRRPLPRYRMNPRLLVLIKKLLELELKEA